MHLHKMTCIVIIFEDLFELIGLMTFNGIHSLFNDLCNSGKFDLTLQEGFYRNFIGCIQYGHVGTAVLTRLSCQP